MKNLYKKVVNLRRQPKDKMKLKNEISRKFNTTWRENHKVGMTLNKFLMQLHRDVFSTMSNFEDGTSWENS